MAKKLNGELTNWLKLFNWKVKRRQSRLLNQYHFEQLRFVNRWWWTKKKILVKSRKIVICSIIFVVAAFFMMLTYFEHLEIRRRRVCLNSTKDAEKAIDHLICCHLLGHYWRSPDPRFDPINSRNDVVKSRTKEKVGKHNLCIWIRW